MSFAMEWQAEVDRVKKEWNDAEDAWQEKYTELADEHARLRDLLREATRQDFGTPGWRARARKEIGYP